MGSSLPNPSMALLLHLGNLFVRSFNFHCIFQSNFCLFSWAFPLFNLFLWGVKVYCKKLHSWKLFMEQLVWIWSSIILLRFSLFCVLLVHLEFKRNYTYKVLWFLFLIFIWLNCHITNFNHIMNMTINTQPRIIILIYVFLLINLELGCLVIACFILWEWRYCPKWSVVAFNAMGRKKSLSSCNCWQNCWGS